MGNKSTSIILIDFGIYTWQLKHTEETHTIRVPVVNKKAPGGLGFEKYPILHPHEVLSYLWDEVHLQIPKSEVSAYWKHTREFGEPWAALSDASDEHVPVGLHGDAARLWTIHRFEKVMAIFLNLPLFRPRSVRHSRFLLFSIPREKLFKNRTLNAVFRRLLWSLEAAYDGVFPQTGVAGRPLSETDQERALCPLTKSGARFALTELRGDWEYHVEVWRPNASWKSDTICFRCPAEAKGASGNLFWNHGDGTWESEEFGLESFVARRLRDSNLCTLAGSNLGKGKCLSRIFVHVFTLISYV